MYLSKTKPLRTTNRYLELEWNIKWEAQMYMPISRKRTDLYCSLICTSSDGDPNLKDASGYNADLGYRGTFKTT
jgi:hypothetical protein